MFGLPASVLLASAVLLLPAMAASLLHRLERATARLLSHWFGWRSLLVTAWLGTPAHELSHLAACKLLGVRVVAAAVFRPDPRSGTLGYVQFVQRGPGLWRAVRRALVATAPLWGILALLVGLWSLLLPGLTSPLAASGLGHALPRRVFHLAARLASSGLWTSWKGWAAAYATICLAAHMAPSPADLQGSGLGLALLAAAWIAASWLLAGHVAGFVPLLAGLAAGLAVVLGLAVAAAGMLHLAVRGLAGLAARSSRSRSVAYART